MTYRIQYAYFCHKGLVRPNNEDNYCCMGQFLPLQHEGSEEILSGSCIPRTHPLFAVFDGMGGEACGETASFLSASSLSRYTARHWFLRRFMPVRFFLSACSSLNEDVCGYAREHKINTMGTTMAALLFGRDHATACNLGDSRIYVLDGQSFSQVSVDHVFRYGLYGKPPLTQYLGLDEDGMEPDPSLFRIEYRPGMRFLLCSDGLSDMISGHLLQEILTGNETLSLSQIAASLLKEALLSGGKDNITAILCEVQEERSGGSPE